MRVTSVNVGVIEEIGTAGVRTAIGKRPVTGPVRVRPLGLDGDSQADRRHHGGEDQALYAYLSSDYGWWSDRLGRDLEPGTFGENLTLDMPATVLNIGDRLLIGRVLLEVTGPRMPCTKLSMVMGDESFAAAFRAAGRPGAYLRVLSDGHIEAGDAVSLIRMPAPAVSVEDVFRLCFSPEASRDVLSTALSSPLSARLRDKFSKRLSAGAG